MAMIDVCGNMVIMISKQTEDELRMQAMFSVASEMTFDELIARGYEMRVGHEVSISAESTACR